MFSSEIACAAYLERIRWPGGFTCPTCGVSDEAQRIMTRPRVIRCRHCRGDVALTAGTVMHATRTPLQAWFLGAYLVTTQTSGVSAVQLQRQLGLARYETAFQMLHKLRAGMVRANRDRIGADWPVEVDETLVGGRTKGEGRAFTIKRRLLARSKCALVRSTLMAKGPKGLSTREGCACVSCQTTAPRRLPGSCRKT